MALANKFCLTNVSRIFCKNVLKAPTWTGNSFSRGLASLCYTSQIDWRRQTTSSISLPRNPQAIPQLQIVRSTSFFNRTSAAQLWKGVTSVSNAGRKRGRGRGIGKKMAKNLNRGQIIGIGNENIQWPGLNAPIMRGKELVQQQKLPKDEEREAELFKLRDSMGVFRPLRLDPLERGWSGTRMPGRSIGPPDPIGEETFEGFDTKVLESKTVTHMSGIFGRVKQLSIFVVTGNGNGLGGFALAKSSNYNGTLKQARNKAAQRLIYFKRYNNHTIMHDFYSRFGPTKIFAHKMPEGSGLVCHRAIRTICETIGIKDLHAKVEGPTKNIQNLTKAFFLGLMQQKSHQEMADEKQLHLVEFHGDLPIVLASPQSGEVRTRDQIPIDEEMNFNLWIHGGKMELQKKKSLPNDTKLYSGELHKKKYAKYRNHEKVRTDLRVRFGKVHSFYTKEHPECVGGYKYFKKGYNYETKQFDAEEET